ncbi:MAG: methyltransferase domain-containing protein [Candidatus Omnitrophica bacterium]|nr:methyltransferase domain-containing protein [Candidatus Omnitrophota bacterium]
MNDVHHKDFKLETTTVWSFPERGKWAIHQPNFRGNWAPQIPRNLIIRYSKPKDLVLDQMCGCGTTLIECKLTGRNAIGFDINPKMVEITKNNLKFDADTDVPKTEISVKVGDARNLKDVKDNSVDLIATHPPYVDIIKYSDGKIDEDLSNIHDIDKFCKEMKKVALECFRVLKPKKYCGILIGDTRRKTYFTPISYRVMQLFLDVGFKLKEDIIKQQWNCETTSYWAEKSKEYNFLLIMHEHLFVFEKQ